MLIDLNKQDESYIPLVYELFKEFVKLAQPFINRKDVDVYIGIWAPQFCFKLPKEFSELIAKTGWVVTIDFND